MSAKKEKIIIFDTTLRDGEQSPGASLNVKGKLEIAMALANMGVDVIEAGFPISSTGDFGAVKMVAQEVKGAIVCGLARAKKEDIDRCWEAVRYSRRPRIHTFIATSDIHLKYKLKKTREEVLRQAEDAVKYACKLCSDVEFSCEDAARSDFDFLVQIVEAAIKCGAKTINIPDTVGYSVPDEFGSLIKGIIQTVPNSDKAIFSVHCHNDLGLATANSLEALINGVRQVECTINGLGERAGNASLEEVVMAIRTRKDLFHLETGIDTTKIYPTSRLVSTLTGIAVQPNKAIVGANAFAHEAGIHQHGIMAKSTTYEIMTPSSIGLKESKLILGKHSGRHAFAKRVREIAKTKITHKQMEKAFKIFKELADKKKDVFEDDIIVIIDEIVEKESGRSPEMFSLDYLNVTTGTKTVPTATVRLKRDKGGKKSGSEVIQGAACGDGPVDAAYKAIEKITGAKCKLVDYGLRSISKGKDALGEVTIRIEVPRGYRTKISTPYIIGKGTSTDIIEASVKAYLNAINKFLSRKSIKRLKVQL